MKFLRIASNMGKKTRMLMITLLCCSYIYAVTPMTRDGRVPGPRKTHYKRLQNNSVAYFWYHSKSGKADVLLESGNTGCNVVISRVGPVV
jgi:hypothetical protein